MIKIDFKKRMKNKTFVASFLAIIIATTYQITTLLDITPRVSETDLMSFVTISLNILVSLGILINPTTDGLSD